MPDIVKELTENPNGEFTQKYLLFLREMRPEWSSFSDTTLINMALVKLGEPVKKGVD